MRFNKYLNKSVTYIVLWTLLSLLSGSVYAQKKATLKFNLQGVDSALVVLNGIDYQLIDTLWVKPSSELTLDAGTFKFWISHKDFKTTSYYESLKAGTRFDVTWPNNSTEKIEGAINWEFQAMVSGATAGIIAEDDTEVFVNGEFVTKGPLLLKSPKDIATKIISKSADGKSQVSSNWTKQNNDFHLIEARIGLYDDSRYNSAFIPGAYFLSRRNYGKGLIRMVPFAASTGAVVLNLIKASKYRNNWVRRSKSSVYFENLMKDRLSTASIFGAISSAMIIENYFSIRRIKKSGNGQIKISPIPLFEMGADGVVKGVSLKASF